MIEKYEIICPHCKGRRVVFDHEDGICTFGIGYVFQFLDPDIRKKCPVCDGTGVKVLRRYVRDRHE